MLRSSYFHFHTLDVAEDFIDWLAFALSQVSIKIIFTHLIVSNTLVHCKANMRIAPLSIHLKWFELIRSLFRIRSLSLSRSQHTNKTEYEQAKGRKTKATQKKMFARESVAIIYFYQYLREWVFAFVGKQSESSKHLCWGEVLMCAKQAYCTVPNVKEHTNSLYPTQ